MSTSVSYSIRGAVSPDELGPLLRITNMGDYSTDKLQHLLSDSTTYVIARSAEILVGFGRMFTDHATIAYINNVAVHPDYQRQGIGTRLLRSLVAEARGVNSIFLYTSTADSLYRRLGFERFDRRLYILRLARDE